MSVCSRSPLAAVAVALLALATRAAAQRVSGDVTTTGFRASTSSGFIAREGQWLPIRAELQVNGSDHFQVAHVDPRSGEVVEIVSRPWKEGQEPMP